MVGVWHGHGMARANQTRPHCVRQMVKTYSKPLAARHGRGTSWTRHSMCESSFSSSSAKHCVPDMLLQLVLVTLCKKVTCKLLTIVRNRRQSRSHWIQRSLSYLVVWRLRWLGWRRQLEQTVSLSELQTVPFKLHVETTALKQYYLTWG